MTSSPFLLELKDTTTSSLGTGHSDFLFPPGSPSSCREGFNPVLTLELPLAPRKDFSNHPAGTAGLSPNAGKKFTNPSHSREPFPCPTVMSPCLPRQIPSVPPQPPPTPSPAAQRRCFFEPLSPLLGRLYCQEPPGSPHPSPCFDQFSLQGSPSLPQRNLCCNLISSPTPQRPCPPSPLTSLLLIHQPPGTGPVTSPQPTHMPLETGPMISTPCTQGSQGNYSMISPLLTHRALRTGLAISPPLAHRPVEMRSIGATSHSHRVLETRPMASPLFSHWSSGRSYNDPPLCSAASPPAGMSGFPFSPQEETLRSPYCVFSPPPESAGSPGSSQPEAPRKPCIESILSWETGRNSYLLLTPSTMISGPPCPTEPPLSQSPHPAMYFPPSLGNQFIAPPQSPRIPPQVKSPKSEFRCIPHRCCSLVNTAQHTPVDQSKSDKATTSPLPLSRSFSLSGPSLMEPAITTASNSYLKEHPSGTTLPPVDPGIIKIDVPASCSHCLPSNHLSPSSYPKSGPPVVSPCNIHTYSVIPSISHPCPHSGSLNPSTGPPQCNNQLLFPRSGTCSAPRGPPPPPHSKSVVPPCSTHIYSFIPLRTPFDPRCLPVVPRVRLCPNTIPCGLHTYSVAPPGPLKEPPKIPYSCPLPLSKNPACSTNLSCSSTIIISECQSSESLSQGKSQSQNKNSHHSKSRSQSRSKSPHRSGCQSHSKSPHHSRSRSRSSSPHQRKIQGQSRSTKFSTNDEQSERFHHGRSRKQSKSPHSGRS
uniref:NOL1/NOP2/Sun domain family, member 4 n=1 Tax=Nannospalax galili TaxID=1026970 RepID=A0A8C6S0M9_NANGA